MSQYLLFRYIGEFDYSSVKINIIEIGQDNEFFTKHLRANTEIGGICEYKTAVSSKGGDTESIFTDCQEALAKGVTFEKTSLYDFLIVLFEKSDYAIFWYGDDSYNLPKFFKKKEII